MSLKSDFFNGLEKRKKKKYDYDIAPVRTNTTLAGDDIAPVRTKTTAEKLLAPTVINTPVVAPEKEWYDKIVKKPELFNDGYQVGDIAKTILGTTADFSLGALTGVGNFAEGVGDTINYGIADIFEKVGNKDFANALREETKKSLVQKLLGETTEKVDKWSVLGDTSDSVAQGLGMITTLGAGGMALGGAGVGLLGQTALTTGGTLFSGIGSGMSEAYEGGATDEEARTYGLISGTADALSELIFGGLGKGINAVGFGKGLSSADDMLAKKVSDLFSNQIAKNLAQYGIKSGAEGFEEVLSGVAQGIGKKITYMSDKELGKILKDESLLEQFVVGAVTSGFAQAGDFYKASKTGTDFVTGLTENEQKVVDKEVENRIAEQEENGEKVSNKDKSKIYDKVVADLDKGYISIDTIESALGGDTYNNYASVTKQEDAIINEYNELGNKPNLSEFEKRRFAELEKQVEEIKNNSQKDTLKSKLGEEVRNLVKDSRLAESYNEKARRGQSFEADLSKYDTKQQDVIKKAVESGVLNNTNRTHEFVDMIAKISADKGVLFDFINNEKLKSSGFALKGKTVNGYKTEDGNIALNIQSQKALESVVGHEITHILEGTELYSALQEAVKQYATTKGEYAERMQSLRELYTGVYKGKDFDLKLQSELTADIIGDYLFSDSNFINSLSTEQPNLFKKIYNEVKYLCKVATAGSKEARELEKVKKAFDNAWKESGTAQKNTTDNGSVEYSISRTQNMSWDDQINGLLKKSGQIKRNDTLVVEKSTPTYLQSDVIEDLPLAIPLSVVTKATNGKDVSHSIEKEKIVDLQKGIKNAEYVIKNPDRNSFAFVTDVKQNEHPILVSFLQNTEFDGDRVHKATSIHLQIDVDSMLKSLPETATIYVKNKNKFNKTVGATNNLRGLSANVEFIDDILPQNSEKSSEKRQYSLSDSDNSPKDVFGFTVKQDAKVNEDLLEELSIWHPDAQVDSDGNVTVYHRTSKENADKIRKTGVMTALEDALFFSSKSEGYVSDYGDTVLAFKIPSTVLRVNDIFDGEVHFDVPLKRINNQWSLNVSKYLVDENSNNTQYSLSDSHKEKQLDIVNKYHPKEDWDYQTWITSVDDIKTYAETVEDESSYATTPDFTDDDVAKALKTGKVTVYSSHDIRKGTFVTPSYMEAKNYAGQGKVNSMVVNLEDVAWIDSLQGQYAPVETDTKYSLSEETDYSRVLEMQKAVNQLTNSIKEIENSDEFKLQINNLSNAIDNGDVDNGVKAYKQWEEESGYRAIKEKRDAMREELDNFNKRMQDDYSRKALEEEKNAIDKSGVSEADYFRKQAVKEFGYTPYFYDAGYITPNGKMLNFSGEKGKHFGSRGNDHRGISIIYANTQGTEALNRFMKDGNIRIMAESPGIDISTVAEPTKEQYATIRRFIYEYIDKEYFNIDFTDEKGNVIGSLEYENRINPTRILNDIKHFYATGEIRGQNDIEKYRYSLSKDGEQPTENGRFYGKDMMLDLPIRQDIQKKSYKKLDDDTPIRSDLAPMTEAEANTMRNDIPVDDGEIAPPVKSSKGNGDIEQPIAKILTKEPDIKKKSKLWSKIKTNFIDKASPFETLSLKTGNREVDAKFNSIRYADSKAQMLIGEGADGVKALNDIQAEVENDGLTQSLYEYLYHKHNVDRMTLEDRYDDVPNRSVFGNSMTAELSQKIVDKYESENPKLIEYANDIYTYNKYLRNLLVEGGVISQETADLWEEMYPHYVPIRRVGDEGLNINVALDTGRTGVNAPIKRATGGNRDILPLFDTMAQRTLQTYKAIAKNRFGIELKNTLGTTIENTATNLDEVIDSIDTQDSLLQEGENGKNPTFTVFENGEKVTFEITDEMYDAMKPTSEGLSNDIEFKIPEKLRNKIDKTGKTVPETIKPLNALSSLQRGVLTEYNPTFMLTNAIKDAQDVFINSQHPARTYKNFPKAIKELTAKGKWYTEYMQNGGADNTYFDKQTNSFNKEKSGLSKAIGFPLEKISEANNFIERIPRLAEYIASRESGRSIDVSMLDAARVTTNFSAGGDVTKFLNRNGATFLNASVQGAAQQVRNIREAKVNGLKGWVQLATKVALAGLPALFLNGLLWDDDEEYEELSDYVKQNYYVVAKTQDGKFVRIPKGRTMAVIQEAFTQIQNALTGDDEVDLQNFLELAVSNLAPNNPLDNNIIAPIKQVIENKTWYGEDLVPTRLQDVPDAEQYDENTDAISKWLGEKLNYSPYKINYLLDQYSGGLGDVVLPMLTPKAESGDNSMIGFLGAPMRDKFSTDSVFNNQNTADFYNVSDELKVNANSSNATDEDVLKSKYFNSISTEISDLYKEKREIQNSNLSDAVKYKQVRDIQEQINQITENALNTYENVNINGSYAYIGDRHYRMNDDGEWQKITDEQLEKQNEVISILGITPSQYWGNKAEYDMKAFYPEKYKVLQEQGISVEDYKENYEKSAFLYTDDYSWAANNPGKYTLSKVITDDVMEYRQYTTDLYNIKADKDNSGKSISGSRKKKVVAYINSLDIEDGAKYVLWKSQYPADKTYNKAIFEYINGRSDITRDEKITILEELGAKVDSNGNVRW